MAEQVQIADGKWLRFSRYEVRDACIAPAPGAKATLYDPWSMRDRPYETLIALAASRRQLRMPSQQPEIVGPLLDWCNRHGVLGTLMHRAVALTLAPRWVRLELADKVQRDIFVPQQDTLLKVPGGWTTRTTEYQLCISKDPSQLGQPVAKDALPSDAPAPSAMLTDLPDISSAGGLLKQEPLNKTWARYFPDVPAWERMTYDYPTPSSREFFAVYGEPVHEFLEAAWLMADALDAITNPQTKYAFAEGVSRLTRLAGQTSATIEQQPDGSLRQRWVSGSLLSSIALMAMEDLATDRLHRCATCDRLFLSSAHQAEYCSPTCRHTAQKRRFRQKYPQYERTARKRRAEPKQE